MFREQDFMSTKADRRLLAEVYEERKRETTAQDTPSEQ